MQRYKNISEFAERHALTLPGSRSHAPITKSLPWRLTSNAPTGQIVGLNQFRGQAIATNGMLVAIESSAGFVRIGHLQWFEVDEDESPDAQATNEKELAKAVHSRHAVSSKELDEVLAELYE